MSKNILIIAAMIAAIFSHGCENANIFDSPGSETEPSFALAPSGEIAVAMEEQGGFAGVHRELAIAANGYVRYVDYTNGEGQIVSLLRPEEYEALVAFFIENDFLNLEESYLESNAADVFSYQVHFQHGGREKEVSADEVRAPAIFRAIVARLHKVIDNVKANALALSFHMDHQTLRHGQSLELTLTATNSKAHALQLASGVQMFEFFALPAAAAPRLPSASPAEVSWNYTHGRAYIALMHYTTLAPGESLTFKAVWEGRGNNGELLEGNYLVGAQMVSTPGGFTPLQPLQIIKN